MNKPAERLQGPEVKRYDLEQGQSYDAGGAYMREEPHGGDWVRSDTYDADIAAAESANASLVERVGKLEEQVKTAKADAITELRYAACSRCRSGLELEKDSRGIWMHHYGGNDWRDCLAGNMHAALAALAPVEEKNDGN